MLPGQTIRVLDPGLGLVDVAADSPLLLGASSLGTSSFLYSFSTLDTIRATLGYGELPEAVAKHLVERGGPVLAMRLPGSVAATTTAVTATGGGPAMSVAGTATMRTRTRVRCKKGGALGVAEFDYSHDYYQPTSVEPVFSEQRVIPSGGTFLFPNIGITATFPSGTYILGATYDFDTEPSQLNAANIATLGAAAFALPTLAPQQWVNTDTYLTSTAGYSAATALGSQLQAFATGFRYGRGHCDVGSSDTPANVITGRATFSDSRVDPVYGNELVSSALPFEGYGSRYASAVTTVAARAARVAPSTSLSRYAEGSLQGTRYIAFNSDVDVTVDNAKITTLRTFPRVPGFYIARGRLAAPPGSDFQFFQYGRLMDIGCAAIYEAMLPFLSDDLRILDGGTLDPLDAAIVQTAGLKALTNALLSPTNARGRPGLVSDVSFTVDILNNIGSTGILQTTAQIRPRAYTDFISQTIGFRLNLGVAA